MTARLVQIAAARPLVHITISIRNGSNRTILIQHGCASAPQAVVRGSGHQIYRLTPHVAATTNTCVAKERALSPGHDSTLRATYDAAGYPASSPDTVKPLPRGAYTLTASVTYVEITGPAATRYKKTPDGALIDTWPERSVATNRESFAVTGRRSDVRTRQTGGPVSAVGSAVTLAPVQDKREGIAFGVNLANPGPDSIEYQRGCGTDPVVLLQATAGSASYAALPEAPASNTCIPDEVIVPPGATAHLAGTDFVSGTASNGSDSAMLGAGNYLASVKITYTVITTPTSDRYVRLSDGSLSDRWITTWTTGNPTSLSLGGTTSPATQSVSPNSSSVGPFTPKVLVLDYNDTGTPDDGSAALTQALVSGLGTGSRYHGGSLSSAQFQIATTKTMTTPPPILSNGNGDYKTLFQQFNICNLALTQGIRFIWVWLDGPVGKWPEWVTTGPTFHQTYGTNVPTCGRTVTTEVLNYTRLVGEAIHSTGHYMENVLQYGFGPGNYNGPGGTSIYDLFDGQLSRYNGYKGALNTTTARCGDVHFPPNAVSDYDYSDTIVVTSACATYNPGKPSTSSYAPVSVSTWRSIPCDASQAYASFDCDEESYLMWWMQNMPGYGNTTIDCAGRAMPNWWQYIVAIDTVTTKTSNNCSRFPLTPGNFTASSPNGSTIMLTWTSVSNATGYKMSDGTKTWTLPRTATSYKITNLQPGTYRCHDIQATNTSGSSAWSAWACVTTLVPPTVPQNFQATSPDPHTITLSWDAVPTAAGYNISDGTSTWTVSGSSTSYTVSGLSPGTYRCHDIQAYNALGSSAWSSWACVTTLAPPPLPDNFQAAAPDGTTIQLTWSAAPTASGYTITDGVSTWKVPGSSTSYTVSGLQPGTYRCHAIMATNAAGNSGWSPWACITTPTPPAAPSDLSAQADNPTQVDLNWTNNATDANGVSIYDGSIFIADVSPTTTSYQAIDISPGSYNCFHVYAYNNAGLNWSDWACVNLPQNASLPGGSWVQPTSDGGTYSTISLSATAQAADGYNVDHVTFTAWWSGLGPQSGPWMVLCRDYAPDSSGSYSCNWDMSGVPHGSTVYVSFDVYDDAGDGNLSPNGEHSFTYP